jgi:hypothetical protein
MKRNKFYQNANTFYYRDKYYIESESKNRSNIIINIFDKEPEVQPILIQPEPNLIPIQIENIIEYNNLQNSNNNLQNSNNIQDCNCSIQNTTPCPKIQCPKQELNYQEVSKNTNNPKVWGPQLWFSFHNGATKYSNNPSPIIKNNMKNFILGIPVIIPCEKCREHANQFIESNYNNLDNIVSSRENLFKFFFDFHNNANIKTNKPEMSYEQVKKLYNFE